jgi:carbonic anhydrase
MRKFFYFISPKERYKCQAAVVWCFDNRFESVLRKLLRRLEIEFFDPIRIAGGTKYLASPEHAYERDFVLEQIRLSMRLHQTESVILMLHSDCGAYGGTAAFDNNREKEIRHHCLELQRATSYLLSQIPELKVRPFFVDFDGVWDIEDQDAQAERIA